MGLDMYVYKIEKPSEAETDLFLGKQTDQIPREYNYIDKETFEKNIDMYRDLIPMVQRVELVDTLFNYGRLREEYHFTDEDVCGEFFGGGGCGWFLRDGRKIFLTDDEIPQYLYDANVEVYFFRSQKVAYWRKSYDLDDFFEQNRIKHRTLDFIGENGKPPEKQDIKSWETKNCGFHHLSMQERRELKEWLQVHEDDAQNDEFMNMLVDESLNLFYKAWW